MLEVGGLRAGYGAIQVLQGIDLVVEKGEIVCLIGSNGAGKTTTMASIAGLLRPVRGRIAMNGQDLTRLAAERILACGIALVPEGRRVFPPLTVRENLEMGAYRRLRAGERSEVARDMGFVHTLFPQLKERADQPAGTLSGGEQQMLAIARALMSRPRLLLLDEPSMGLAPMVVADIFRTIGELNQEGITILLAEQNARMALRTAKRGYVLQSGRVVQVADAPELLEDRRVQEAYLGV